MSGNLYIGTELDVFAHAGNWKAYLRQLIAPYLRGDVVEVGAGIGATTCAFRDAGQASWLALEPDPRLAAQLRARVAGLAWPVDVSEAFLSSLPGEARFDCALYVDVLEHIEDDAGELSRAAARLRPGGALVVLSPAHQALYSPFDAAIGHYRRYSKQQLAAVAPASARLVHIQYVDSIGLAVSAGNRLLLRSAAPTLAQVLFWDRWCVPVSRRLDRTLGGRLGKSVLAVWRHA
jgi:SAM-dependent methyltransferase